MGTLFQKGDVVVLKKSKVTKAKNQIQRWKENHQEMPGKTKDPTDDVREINQLIKWLGDVGSARVVETKKEGRTTMVRLCSASENSVESGWVKMDHLKMVATKKK